jgi:hypothetical protein
VIDFKLKILFVCLQVQIYITNTLSLTRWIFRWNELHPIYCSSDCLFTWSCKYIAPVPFKYIYFDMEHYYFIKTRQYRWSPDGLQY